MNRSHFHACRAFALIAAAVASSAGCAVPYAYPKLEKTQTVRLAESLEGVTAFRVEYTAAGNPKWDRRANAYQIGLLRLDPQRTDIPEQARVGVERGLYLYMFHLTHDLKVDEGVEVRLYKRGYRCFQINRNYQGGEIRMLAATTEAEREDAIDTMFGPDVAGFAMTQPADDTPPVMFAAEEIFHFAPTRTPEYLSACAFGAQEYAALAGTMAAPADRERIQFKQHVLQWLSKGR